VCVRCIKTFGWRRARHPVETATNRCHADNSATNTVHKLNKSNAKHANTKVHKSAFCLLKAPEHPNYSTFHQYNTTGIKLNSYRVANLVCRTLATTAFSKHFFFSHFAVNSSVNTRAAGTFKSKLRTASVCSVQIIPPKIGRHHHNTSNSQWQCDNCRCYTKPI